MRNEPLALKTRRPFDFASAFRTAVDAAIALGVVALVALAYFFVN